MKVQQEYYDQLKDVVGNVKLNSKIFKTLLYGCSYQFFFYFESLPPLMRHNYYIYTTILLDFPELY